MCLHCKFMLAAPQTPNALLSITLSPWATLDSRKDRPLSEYLLLQSIIKSHFVSFISFNPTASDTKYKSCMRYIRFLHTLGIWPLRETLVHKATWSPSLKTHKNLQITRYLEFQSSEVLGNGAVLSLGL